MFLRWRHQVFNFSKNRIWSRNMSLGIILIKFINFTHQYVISTQVEKKLNFFSDLQHLIRKRYKTRKFLLTILSSCASYFTKKIFINVTEERIDGQP